MPGGERSACLSMIRKHPSYRCAGGYGAYTTNHHSTSFDNVCPRPGLTVLSLPLIRHNISAPSGLSDYSEFSMEVKGA